MSIGPFAWTHAKTRVEFDGASLTVDDRRLPLHEIDRLARTLTHSTAQGSYNRLDCSVHLFAHGKVSSVRFRGDASKPEWGPWRPMWDQLDGLIRGEVETRLLQRTLDCVRDDGAAEIGGGRAKARGRFTVTAEGIQARRMFARPIAWSSVVALTDGDIEVTTEDADGNHRRRRLGLHAMEWDGWQVPRLWERYRG